jgi:broad specificity polyphosphatase/5'/3'-nucleotidase SurE
MANNSESGPSDWKKPFVNMPPFDPNAMWKKIQEKKAREEEARKKKQEREEEQKRREQYHWDNLWAAMKEKEKREEAIKARSTEIPLTPRAMASSSLA